MNTKETRRQFFKTFAGLSAIVLAEPFVSLARGSFEKLSSSSTDDYDVYKTDESYETGHFRVRCEKKISDNNTDSPNYYIFMTKNEQNNLTYLSSDNSSIGFNPFLRNGFRFRARVGGNVEMYIQVESKGLMGGFYEGSNPQAPLIYSNLESVRINIKEGEISCFKMPQWDPSFPVMLWEADSSGNVSSGNVAVRVRNGLFKEINTHAIAPFRAGATPFYIRSPKEPQDIFIGRNGVIVRFKNKEFKGY